MKVVGKVESLWRYPVKSMRGEQLAEAFIGIGGVRGDRLYAFHSAAAPVEFPYFTGRELHEMLLYRPVWREADGMLDVETPTGEVFAIDDPRLIQRLGHGLTLMRSERALADCHPLSLISTGTARQLGAELGSAVDKRRFRANVYLDLESGEGFGEDAFVGGTLQIGAEVVVSVVKRDGRCKMITLDPDTGQPNPEIMRLVSQSHEGKAGVYATVLVEGMIRPGDAIMLMK